MGLIPHSSTYYQMCVGSYCYVPSYQAPKTAASRGPEWVMFIRCGEPPGMFDRGARSLPRVVERAEKGRQVVKSHMPGISSF
jgi:hypothetical protein